MKGKDVLLWAVASVACLAGTAVAQEPAHFGTGYSFQSGSGLVGGAEMLFLRAYGGSYDRFAHSLMYNLQTPSNEYKISPRLWLGYVNPSGFGVRGRWFQYDHTLNAGTDTLSYQDEFEEVATVGRNRLNVYAVDVDLMQRVDLGCWNVNAGAGLRVGGVTRRTTKDSYYENIWGDEYEESSTHQSRFEGIGPTVFAELKRPIMGTGFSLIANARGSLLFGESKLWTEDYGEVWHEVWHWKSDVVVAGGEIQLGGEYARPLGYGTTGFVQCLWEGQAWANASEYRESVHGRLRRDDLGLMGVAINFGITR